MSVVRWLGGVSKEKFDALENEIESLKSIDTGSTDSESTVTKEDLDGVRAQIQGLGIVEKKEEEQMKGFKARLDQQSKINKKFRDDVDCLNTKIVAQEAGEDEVVKRIKKLEEAKASALSKQDKDIQQQINKINKKVDGVVAFTQKMAKTAVDANNDTRQMINRAFNTRDNTIGNRFGRRKLRRSKSMGPGKIKLRNTIVPE